jgi:hypothetical protein
MLFLCLTRTKACWFPGYTRSRTAATCGATRYEAGLRVFVLRTGSVVGTDSRQRLARVMPFQVPTAQQARSADACLVK